MRMYQRFAHIVLVAVASGILGAASAGAQGGATDPVGYFSVTFPGGAGDTMSAFNIGLVTPEEVAGAVASVSGTKITFDFAFDPSILPDGGLFTIRSGTTPGLNVDATGFANPNPNTTEITLSRSVDGLVSVGDSFSVRSHTTLADFLGSNNEAAIKGGTSAELADNVAIWDAATQTATVYYWHTTDGWVEAGKEVEGDKSSVPIRFPSGGMFTRRDPADVTFTRAGHVLVPTEQQVFPVKAGVNLIACSLLLSDDSDFAFSDYGLYEAGSPLSVNGGAAAPEADVMIYSRMNGSPPSAPLYYRSDGAGGGNWQFVGGSDAGALSVNGFAVLQFFRTGSDGFIKFSGASIAPAPLRLAAAPVTQIQVGLTFVAHNAYRLTWQTVSGAEYQIQKQDAAGTQWDNVGDMIAGDGAEISKTTTLEGAGRIRVITP